MLKPLQQWTCDTCGDLINTPEDGYVEWLHDRETKLKRGFRIVHHAPRSPRKPGGQDCYQYSGQLGNQDLALSDFLGDVGMIRILSFLDPGEHHVRDYRGPRVADLREFIELVRRLRIPFYEEARHLLPEAGSQDGHGGANEIYIYTPEYLQSVIQQYS